MVATPFLEAKDSRSFLTDQILIFSRFYLLFYRGYVFFIGAHVHIPFERESRQFLHYVRTDTCVFILFPRILTCVPTRFFKCVIEFSLGALIIIRHNVIFNIIVFSIE